MDSTIKFQVADMTARARQISRAIDGGSVAPNSPTFLAMSHPSRQHSWPNPRWKDTNKQATCDPVTKLDLAIPQGFGGMFVSGDVAAIGTARCANNRWATLRPITFLHVNAKLPPAGVRRGHRAINYDSGNSNCLRNSKRPHVAMGPP